ncbi:kinase-like protein, partial [Exidia glandulosa HHB12029]
HQRILPFIGISRYNMNTVLVSQYYPKGNLTKYLLHNPTADRHRLVLEVAEAVNFLHHEAGAVHGDLKCDNVLISDEDTAVLADFGLSTVVEKSEDDLTTVTDIRRANTLRFCAPELLLDDGVLQGGRRRSKTKESDVYAFGMLILQVRSRVAMIPSAVIY